MNHANDRAFGKSIGWSAGMKKISTTRANRFIATASIICFAVGLALSHRIEPGVRVQKVTLAEETPALKFIPAGAGPHPVGLGVTRQVLRCLKLT